MDPASSGGKAHIDARLDQACGYEDARALEHLLTRMPDAHESTATRPRRLWDEPVCDAIEAACHKVAHGYLPHCVADEIGGDARCVHIDADTYPRGRRIGIDLDVVDGEYEGSKTVAAFQLFVRGVPLPVHMGEDAPELRFIIHVRSPCLTVRAG